MAAAKRQSAAVTLPRTVSGPGLALIKAFEACRLRAYLPTPRDVPTIGWGATRCADGSPVRIGMVWTQHQADARFTADVARFAGRVSALCCGSRLSWFEFDALVSLAYNIGLGAFEESTLLRLHRDGNHADASEQFARWNRQTGTVLAGLSRRRAAEAAHYRGHIFAGRTT